MTISLCHSWANNSFTHFLLLNNTKIIMHKLFEKFAPKRNSGFNNFKSIMRVNSYKV